VVHLVDRIWLLAENRAVLAEDRALLIEKEPPTPMKTRNHALS